MCPGRVVRVAQVAGSDSQQTQRLWSGGMWPRVTEAEKTKHNGYS